MMSAMFKQYCQDEVKSSPRNLGIVLAVVCGLIGFAKGMHDGYSSAVLWLVLCCIFLALALWWQAPLKPLNILWHRLGLVLHAIVNPVVMGIIFFAVLTPTGMLLRLMGKDVLRLKKDETVESYWIKRQEFGVPETHDMKNQF